LNIDGKRLQAKRGAKKRGEYEIGGKKKKRKRRKRNTIKF
jgi:hypothetical protein